ncbi:MAG: response regulator transcription factor [Actinomycetota bacterium]
MAAALSISEATVKFHMTNILAKLHLENRAQVVAYAHRHGLAAEDDGGSASG